MSIFLNLGIPPPVGGGTCLVRDWAGPPPLGGYGPNRRKGVISMTLTNANPTFGPAEQGIMLEMSDLLIDSERCESIPTHSKISDFRPWRTRAPEPKNLVFGALGTEISRF